MLVYVETLGGVSTQFSFFPLFPVLLISLGSKSGAPFLPERAKTCQHYFWIFFSLDFASDPTNDEAANVK